MPRTRTAPLPRRTRRRTPRTWAAAPTPTTLRAIEAALVKLLDGTP
ncbi:hypothetical protein [Streptomyces sp. NPDC046909]